MKRVALALAMVIALVAPSFAQLGPQDRSVLIDNRTNQTIQRLYASSIARQDWGRDRLGSGVLPPNYAYNFNFADYGSGCDFDIKVIFANGREVVDRINVCRVSVWTYR